MEYALGMIETHGHTAAVEALDAANKASNIILPSMVHVGSGRVAISFFGDVAAVKVAVDCGVAAAEKVGKVLASNVIARLDKQVLNSLFEYASNNNAVVNVVKEVKEDKETEEVKEDKETEEVKEDKETEEVKEDEKLESNTEIINENANNESSENNVNNDDALLFDEDINKKTNNEIDSNRTVSKKKSRKKKKNNNK